MKIRLFLGKLNLELFQLFQVQWKIFPNQSFLIISNANNGLQISKLLDI